jgi:hypothetical protein
LAAGAVPEGDRLEKGRKAARQHFFTRIGRRRIGEPCQEDDECATARCGKEQCVECVDTESDCEASHEYCDPKGRCSPKLKVGEGPCDYNDDCEAGAHCADGFAGIGTGKCEAGRAFFGDLGKFFQ